MISAIIALVALLGGHIFLFRNSTRQKTVLTILQSFDLGDQAFSGEVIEN